MIGVLAKPGEMNAVQEFFQLFKTPWEFYVPNHDYDLALVTTPEIPDGLRAKVLAIYNSQRTGLDEKNRILTELRSGGTAIDWDGVEFPLYGEFVVLQDLGQRIVKCREGSESVAQIFHDSTRQTVRVGYDLFQEVDFLLSKGQPHENAQIPTLEIHIALLRSFMIRAGVPFVEIPPIPAGYEFMACLTHDVDFTGIREHKCDHTIGGFIYRALVGSLWDALRGRVPWSRCWRNWKAVFSLPFVYLGWLEDFWLEFDRYSQIEAGLGSTYYFIPFKNYPGTLGEGMAPTRRAAKYDLMATKNEVRKLRENGCEVGLHGIDAWQSSEKGKSELQRIHEATGQARAGIRMHWLYFDENSPKVLEEAGFNYDSTFGYNDAVGFRAGTSQVFCIPPADSLLELPLIIQDTAMLYPGRMHLTEARAIDLCKGIIELAPKYGGVLTVNWHTRSLSPERLWGEFYLSLLKEIQRYRVWFGTAQEIVTWYQNRRAIQFNEVQFTEDSLRVQISAPTLNGNLPVVVRVYHANLKTSSSSTSMAPVTSHSDTPWNGEPDLKIPLT